MSRADLLALTPESVAALANVGLVKRAQKELAAGQGPSLAEDDAGLVVGTFPDGVVTKLPAGTALRDTLCSCNAVGACRHRVAVALAYAAWHASKAPAPEAAAPAAAPVRDWSPGELNDVQLEQFLGKRVLDRARLTLRAGLTAEVVRPDATGAVPAVRLATTTVRFLVPEELSYAKCDCATPGGCEHVALAAFAFRAADARDRSARSLVVSIEPERTASSVDLGALDESLSLARALLLEGVTQTTDAWSQRFVRARTPLESAGFTWAADLVDDLESLLDAYRRRSARYSPAAATSLVVELVARRRAARGQGELPARYVLGVDEARETLLEHVRLVSLGARVTSDGEDAVEVECLLADPDSGIVLVLPRRFEGPATSLATRMIARGVQFGLVASGQLVSKGVKRRSNRAIALGLGRTAVSGQTGEWGTLPAPLLARDFATLAASLRARPPRVLRPRVRAEDVHVLAVARVEDVRYAPGDQAVLATLVDMSGAEVQLVRRHRACAPKALESLASALAGTVRFVSGEVRAGPRGLEIEPLAVVTDRVVVPDAVTEAPGLALPLGELRSANGATSALVQETSSLVEEALHRGLRMLLPSWGDRAARLAARLRDSGFADTGAALDELSTHVRAMRAASDGERAAADAWVEVALRLALATEAL